MCANTPKLLYKCVTKGFHFGESGIPVPGKPELFPNSGEVGGRTNDPWPAAVGDSGMPESDVGKAD